MPILKVTVWDKSVCKKKKLICATSAAELPGVRRNLAALIGRYDLLEKIEANSNTLIILDIAVAVEGKDYKAAEWNSTKDITTSGRMKQAKVKKTKNTKTRA